jgi:uncharacterized phage protein (TIGR02220 family)
MGLTMHERGQYITLLCLQHTSGHLSEKEIALSVGEVSEDVLKKFTKDENGKYFNPRMEEEAEKRKAFTESRRKSSLSRFKKASYDTSYDEHTIHRMGNENKNINKDVIKDVITYLNSKLNTKYQYTAEYINKHINARLNEGFKYEDFVTVIDKKYKEWYGTDMAKYLRPETLFSPKFQQYLNQLGGDQDAGGGTLSGATKESHPAWSGTWV